MKFISILFLFLSYFTWGQFAQIEGYAPKYIGKNIEIYAIEDYISLREVLIGEGKVNTDSTFSIKIPCKETQKVILKADYNTSFLYVQPHANYQLFVPEKDAYEPYRPTGNKIEITFLDLDSSDINYKILTFQRYTDNFIGNYFYLKGKNPAEFGQKLTDYKKTLETALVKDTDVYFLTFVRFTVAKMDNISFSGERNRYEKFDFYLKNPPVFDKNDAYMNYINSFYDKLEGYLTMETNNRIYLGIKKASPNAVMKALDGEYTLSNMKLRELIMIKHLSHLFYQADFPKENILIILDSVSRYSFFKSNALTAKNVKFNLSNLISGGSLPYFEFVDQKGITYSPEQFKGKYTYFHFVDLTSQKSIMEIDPLVSLFKKYQNDINFVTFYKSNQLDEKTNEIVKKIPWTTLSVNEQDEFWNNYQVKVFPYYILVDPQNYVSYAPCLGPLPNSNGKTIEETFFSIQLNNRRQRNY